MINLLVVYWQGLGLAVRLDECLLVRGVDRGWMEWKCRWCGLGGIFCFCWKGWGKGMFDVIWCGHWCYREGRKEGFKDCRLP